MAQHRIAIDFDVEADTHEEAVDLIDKWVRIQIAKRGSLNGHSISPIRDTLESKNKK